MGDISSEPSMEEILSSIKKIIAEDSVKAVSGRLRPGSRAATPTKDVVPAAETLPEPDVEAASEIEADDDSIFELTEDAIPDDTVLPDDTVSNDTVPNDAAIASDTAISESRTALSSLSKLIVKPEIEGSDTLEAMVREMLRPMLKDWLDAHLADIVRGAVTREVARIAARDS